MVLDAPHTALEPRTLPDREPGDHEVLLDVRACAVCRTDLHILDGELAHPKLPLVPGHQVVGRVIAVGPASPTSAWGTGSACRGSAGPAGAAATAAPGRENLCDRARFTGYQLPGGYAERVVADERYCFAIPDAYDDAHAAPLLRASR